MTRVDLPSGGWVELRDPRLVSERACRPVRRAMQHLSAAGREALAAAAKTEAAARERGETLSVDPDLSDADVDALWDLNDQLAAALVELWSFPDPPTVDTITALPRGDYEALVAAAAPSLAGVFFDTGYSPEAKADPLAVGVASSGSDSSSAESLTAAT